MTGVEVAGVALLGGAGAVLRHGVSGALARRAADGFPWGTFVVNMLGSFLLGLLVGADPGTALLLLAGGGLLGAFTTFSALALEVRTLAARHAVVYITLSFAGGLMCVWAGARIAG